MRAYIWYAKGFYSIILSVFCGLTITANAYLEMLLDSLTGFVSNKLAICFASL